MVAGRRIDLPDRGATFLRRYAVLRDVAVRSDGDVEARAVGARDHVLGPVPVDRPRRQLDHRLARLSMRGLTFLIRKAHQRVGVGDVEVAAHQRHAEGRAQPVEEHAAGLDDAVAVGIAQQGYAIGARPGGAGALHQELHHPAFDAAAVLWSGRRAGSRRPARRHWAARTASADDRAQRRMRQPSGPAPRPASRQRASPWPEAILTVGISVSSGGGSSGSGPTPAELAARTLPHADRPSAATPAAANEDERSS